LMIHQKEVALLQRKKVVEEVAEQEVQEAEEDHAEEEGEEEDPDHKGLFSFIHTFFSTGPQDLKKLPSELFMTGENWSTFRVIFYVIVWWNKIFYPITQLK